MSLQDRFPDLRPISSAPALFRVNGCGLGMYGRRDFDQETGTYISTHCICLVFIPLLTLGAYRVADAENGGWYFVGKERLSTFAKAWNAIFVLLVLGGVGYAYLDKHWKSAEYQYAQKLQAADKLLAQGEAAQAAPLYREVIEGRSAKAPDAVAAIDAWLAGPGKTAPVTQVEPMLQAAEAARIIGAWPGAADAVFQRGVELAQPRAEKAPQEAIKLVSVVAAGAPDPTKFTALRLPWLEAWHKQEPKNVECAGELAVCYESTEAFDKCEALLAPLGRELIGTEGGRIWGQLLARDGKFVESCDYLLPYCTSRLEKLHAAEQESDRVAQEVQTRVISRLDQGDGPPAFYTEYKSAGEERQREMVVEYMMKELREDAAFKLAQEKLQAATGIVPVALDLGMALLQRAQQATNPEDRQSDLEKAEKTFLAVGGVAGESNTYRLNLGQVYYWLGKQAEGRKLFDDLIAANGNDFAVGVGVTRVLREVGAISEARKMAEDLYSRESGQNKFDAAQMRALMHIDLDDELLWLQRCDPVDKTVQATLHSTRGQKAIQEGRDEEALVELRKGAEIYAQMAPTASSLNNAALCYFQMFSASGNTDDHQQAIEMMEKAVALLPGDSILLSNYTGSKLNAALLEVIGDRLQWKTLRQSATTTSLSYLYDDQEARTRLTEELKQSDALKKVQENAKRLQVLQPKGNGGYSIEVELARWTDDVPGLEQLLVRVQAADLDLVEEEQRVQDLLTRKDFEKLRTQINEGYERSKTTVARARTANHPPTLAMAICNSVQAQVAASAYGAAVDADTGVTLAEEAVAAHPCLATRRTLILALLERASSKLKALDSTYASVLQEHGERVGGSYLLGLLMQEPGQLRDKALAQPDVQRAITQIKELGERLPDSQDEPSWHLLKQADADSAAKVAQAISKASELADDVRVLLSPLSPAGVADRYLALIRRGDQVAAKKLLEDAKTVGITLPFVKS